MDAIQTLFSKNAHWRNVLFVIVFPLAVLMLLAGLFWARVIYMLLLLSPQLCLLEQL